MDSSLCRTGTEVAVTYTGPEQIATLHHQLFTDNSYSSSSCSIEHKVQRIEDSMQCTGTADRKLFFKNAGDQIVTRRNETIT